MVTRSENNHGHERHAAGRDVRHIDGSCSSNESAINFKHGRHAKGRDSRHVDGQRAGRQEEREEKTVTDTDDTPAGETFGVLTVAGAPMSLPSTSNTEDTPMGKTPDILMGSVLADRGSLRSTTDTGDTPMSEMHETRLAAAIAAGRQLPTKRQGAHNFSKRGRV